MNVIFNVCNWLALAVVVNHNANIGNDRKEKPPYVTHIGVFKISCLFNQKSFPQYRIQLECFPFFDSLFLFEQAL